MLTDTITTGVVCPHCHLMVEPKEIYRSLRILRGQRRRYTVQYECPDCRGAWWGHEWRER